MASSFHVRFIHAQRGTLDEQCVVASDATAAAHALEVAGHRVISTQATHALRTRADLDLREFALELRALLLAGLGVVAALEALQAARGDSMAGQALSAVLARVHAGKSLAAALEAAIHVFPPLFRASVRGGEASGCLAESLQRYADYHLTMVQLKRSLVGAALYPAVVVSFGVAVMLFLLAYVVPRFESAYAALPPGSRAGSGVLMMLASWVSNHIALILTALLLVLWWAYRAGRQPHTRVQLLQALARITVVARGIRAYFLARLYRTLAMMLVGGYTVPEGLHLGAEVLEGTPWHAALERVRTQVEAGKPVAQALQAEQFTSVITERLIAAGEASARLPEMFEHAAAHHERELAWLVERTTRLAEPVLLMLVALMVGVIVVAMYMPILDLATAVG